MMKTITKFMTLCALFVGVNVSAQTTLSPSATVIHSGEYADEVKYVEGAESWKITYSYKPGRTTLSDLVTATYGSSYAMIAKFDASSILDGRIVTSAKLNYSSYCTVATKKSNVQIYQMNGTNWNATTATWNSINVEENFGCFGTVLSDVNHNNTKTSVEVDVTDLLSEDEDKVIAFVFTTATGREQEISDLQLVVESADASSSSIYTLKYMCGADVLKTVEYTGANGFAISVGDADKEPFFNADNTKKYIYVSDDSEGKTIASDGSTVVTVTCREAETYSYSVKSSTGEVLANGSNFEGESITIPYPMYVNEDGVLYQADVENSQYNHVFTLTTNAQEEVITYNETEIVDVVMLVEAETLLGMTPSTGNNGTATIRSSNAKVAYPAEDVQIITIPAGKYRIVVDIYGGQKAPGELTMTIDEASHTFTSVSQTYHSIQSWDVELTKEESPLMALKGGGNGVAYDFIYIIKTGNVTPISDINADKAVDNDYYDLSGRKVVNPVKGNIYINGGKLIRY